MKIQVNTDHNIHAHEAFLKEIEATVESALGHLAVHVTRVEVHVTDENAQKHGRADKRCVMEARLEKHQPIAVTEEAANVEEAVEGAAQKLKRLLEHTVSRLGEHKGLSENP
jgi:ribosome-associated translation inhibitor RaiA